MKQNTPVLFIIFNRPEVAKQSFEHIRQVRPQKLYIASDGPRDGKNDESEIVKKTRDVILNAVDWDCEVKTLFRKKNLGCSQGVFTAINWFFENEERGIILEDDCVINNTFYRYMSELLDRYENDQRIGMIAGTNPSEVECKSSYFFSRFKSCWGWATWKRAWINMDMDMKWRNEHIDDIFYNSGYAFRDKDYWKWELKYIDNGCVSAWDWQWYFTLAAQNQLCIYPKKNLVTNIGNDSTATHRTAYNTNFKSYEMQFPLVHPMYFAPNPTFENAFYRRNHTLKKRIGRLLPFKVKEFIKSILY